MLDSANPKMNIDEKNTGTTNEKLVFEDGYGYQHMSDSYVGGTVTFKSTISVATDGPKNLSFHDKMEEGLTFDSGSVTVTKEGSNTSLAADVDYVLTTKAADGCTFEVNFTESCTDALKAGDKLNVDYRATLNENAKVNGPNRNESYIKYGNSTFTPPSVTRTYTWSFDVFKYTNNNGEKALAGAEFTLKKADDNWKAVGSAIRFKKTGEGTYLCAAEGDTSSLVTEKNGKLNLAGLERGNYLLEEIKAPDGYNKLEKPVKVEIVAEPANANTELVSKIMTENGNGSFKEAASGTVKVLNVTGTLLPSTGGMGTTVFYFAGAILVLGGGIVLIARKRAASVD
jgi:fimbrial isopeptide formation D2 family protein/LPXTG-motif cell wall-anchored protein